MATLKKIGRPSYFIAGIFREIGFAAAPAISADPLTAFG
jgi:hypothetical protein